MCNSPYVGKFAWILLVSSCSPENKQFLYHSSIPLCQPLEYTRVPFSCSPDSLMALANSFSRKFQSTLWPDGEGVLPVSTNKDMNGSITSRTLLFYVLMLCKRALRNPREKKHLLKVRAQVLERAQIQTHQICFVHQKALCPLTRLFRS